MHLQVLLLRLRTCFLARYSLNRVVDEGTDEEQVCTVQA